MKRGYLRGRLIDFLVFLALFSALALAFSFVRKIMYGEEDYVGKVKITTQPISNEIAMPLTSGDILYDTVTKRRVGEILTVEMLYNDEESYRLSLTADIARLPRSNALRSPDVYLEIREVIRLE